MKEANIYFKTLVKIAKNFSPIDDVSMTLKWIWKFYNMKNLLKVNQYFISAFCK